MLDAVRHAVDEEHAAHEEDDVDDAVHEEGDGVVRARLRGEHSERLNRQMEEGAEHEHDADDDRADLHDAHRTSWRTHVRGHAVAAATMGTLVDGNIVTVVLLGRCMTVARCSPRRSLEMRRR